MTNQALPIEPPPGDALTAGLAALQRHDWSAAYELLTKADSESPLTGPELESYADVAFFAGHPDAKTDLMERAFKAHLTAGDETRAAYLAFNIASEYGYSGKMSIASAWLRRGERLIDGKPESYATAALALVRSQEARFAGRVDEGLSLAEEAVEIARRTTDADLQAAALSNLGELKIATGATNEGIAYLEEASISAVNGELSPFTTGATTCRMISACRDLTDYRRASEWTEATDKWCRRELVSGFPGICRIHRAEVTAIGGAWERAEDELRRAAVELADYKAPPLADGLYAIGDIRRLKGDYEGAEESLREAHTLGRAPLPALALIRLAQGRTKAAATMINSAVAEQEWDQWARARLLPAQIEIGIANGDVAMARTAAEELERITSTYASPALSAGREMAWGRVLLAEGDAAGAAHRFRDAIREWREVGAPYEIGRARALLAQALRMLDDEESADLELRAARDEFARLGAIPDATSATRELEAAESRRSGPVSARKTFMFTDIVGSTNLAEALGDVAWERLLRWHDDTLRDVVAKSGGEIVNSTGDGFFVAFDTARQAIDGARAVQQALDAHRETTGFAIAVRIGLHAADANRRGADYSGVGVHLAARVAGAAGGGEIIATTETIAEAGETAVSPAREVALRGVSAPVSIANVTWSRD
jgi:class 3 adenylate cyclase